VGHVDFYKGLDVILDAWNVLPPSGFELTVIGAAEAAWRDYFIDRIDRTPNATYRRPVPSSEMATVYAAHDVLAFPSLVGGVGFATLEALASGLAVIVPDDEGLLRPGIDCLIASTDSPDAWAQALLTLKGDSSLRGQLAAEGVLTAKRLSFSSYVGAVRAAYSTIAERERLPSIADALHTTTEAP
jgi:glycosyltransferase involved in cell wall biosynthesis